MPSPDDDRISRLAELLPDAHRRTWLELSEVLGYPARLFNLHADLEDLLALCKFASKNSLSPDFLRRWLATAQYLYSHEAPLSTELGFLGKQFPTSPRGPRYSNRYEGHFPEFPVPACLSQRFDLTIRTGGNHLKIALIILAYRQHCALIQKQPIANFADDVRKAARSSFEGFTILQRLEGIAVTPDKWIATALKELRMLPDIEQEPTTPTTDILNKGNSFEKTIYLTSVFIQLLELAYSGGIKKQSLEVTPLTFGINTWMPLQAETGDELPDTEDISNKPLQIRLPLPPPQLDDANYIGLEPESVDFDIAEAVPVDAEIPVRAVEKQQQHYSNYRTALGQQRLPYAWDQLNPCEIEVLVRELRRDLSSKDISLKVPALLVTLVMLTGTEFNSLLGTPLYEQDSQSCLLKEGIWVRYVRPARGAFVPSSEQLPYLRPHTSYNHHHLPNTVKVQIHNLFTRPGETVVDALGIDKTIGERIIREYLTNLRATYSARLTIGRIRQVLGNAMMKARGDKTLAHHQTACVTDMPPATIYYISYDAEEAADIYRESVEAFFGYD